MLKYNLIALLVFKFNVMQLLNRMATQEGVELCFYQRYKPFNKSHKWRLIMVDSPLEDNICTINKLWLQ